MNDLHRQKFHRNHVKLKESKSPLSFYINEHASSHKCYILDGYFTTNGYPFDELMNKSELDYRPVFTMSFSIPD